MKKAMIVISAMLMATQLIPSTTLGGDRTRGVARPVLAGTVIASAVMQHMIHGPPPSRSWNPPEPPMPPPEDFEMMPPPPPGEPPMPPPALYGVMQKAARIERMERVVTERRNMNERGATRNAPVIIQLEDGRRLFQPAIHGHPAFIQVWSSIQNEWISITEHPSIW